MNWEPLARIEGPFTDGLTKLQRWERDCAVALVGIVQRVCEGERLKVICLSRGWPYSVVAAAISSSDEWTKAYEQALRISADDMAQETVAIADDADPDNVPHAKHRTDVRLKVAGKLYRERYGESVQHNVVVDPFGDMLERVSERRLAVLRQAQAPERDITPVGYVRAADPI